MSHYNTSYQIDLLLKVEKKSLSNNDISDIEKYSETLRRFKYQNIIYLQRIVDNFNSSTSKIGDIVLFKKLLPPIGESYLQFEDTKGNKYLLSEFELLTYYVVYQNNQIELSNEDLKYIDPYITEQYINGYIDRENCSFYEIGVTISKNYGANKMKTHWTYNFPLDDIYAFDSTHVNSKRIEDINKWTVDDTKSVVKISDYSKILYLVNEANNKKITPEELLININLIEKKNK